MNATCTETDMDATASERKFDGAANGWFGGKVRRRTRIYGTVDVEVDANGEEIIQGFKVHVPWLRPSRTERI